MGPAPYPPYGPPMQQQPGQPPPQPMMGPPPQNPPPGMEMAPMGPPPPGAELSSGSGSKTAGFVLIGIGAAGAPRKPDLSGRRPTQKSADRNPCFAGSTP